MTIPGEPAKPKADLLIRGATEVLTCVPFRGDPVGRIRNASVAIAGEHIVAVGSDTEVLKQVDTSSARVIDASERIIAPGFVDSHTHLVFGGSRVQEYAARMTLDEAQVRGLGIPMGINATVDITRAQGVDGLTLSAAQRLSRMLCFGTTTVESKSGYGLSVSEELKLLEVNRRLRSTQPVDVVSTFLGAHALPFGVSRERYVDTVIREMIPRVVEGQLAEFCDVYCDEGYFSVDESYRILEAGRRAGLRLKIHADAYSAIGASRLAAELGAVSADHLNYTDRASTQALVRADVVGVVMPMLDFAVQHQRPVDARALLSEGMMLALATDLCPACWVESMQLVMAFACRACHLSPAEALYAATVGGARSLGLEADRGSLEVGKLADLQIWDVQTFEDVIYRLGHNAVEAVIKRGRVSLSRRRPHADAFA